MTKQGYRVLIAASAFLMTLLFGTAVGTAQSSSTPQPLTIAEQGRFFVGGHYNNENEVVGQMYVEYQIPQERTHEHPVVFIHGGGQIGSGWWTTPDGREGWAPYFMRQGYAVYVVDVPARGRSPYDSDLGALSDPFNVDAAQQLWAAPGSANLWPAAKLHTQWVGEAIKGDPTFEQFMKSQSDSLPDQALQENLTADALVALLDQIGPAILVPHSQPGWPTWRAADRRPEQVKALLALEVGPPARFELQPLISETEIPWGLSFGPITYSPAVSNPSELNFEEVSVTDDPYVESCWLQAEPARELPNLQKVPILLLSSEAGYNTQWDPCTSRYLDQAGVEHTWIRLEEIGIRGNGHFYFIEKNSDQVADVILDWLEENVQD